jgi:hypothetical protein
MDTSPPFREDSDGDSKQTLAVQVISASSNPHPTTLSATALGQTLLPLIWRAGRRVRLVGIARCDATRNDHGKGTETAYTARDIILTQD